MLNILFVHETEYIDKVTFEYQIIPELLSEYGHNVYAVDFPTHWKKNHVFDFRSTTEYFYNVRKSHKKKGITLIRPGFIKIPILSRISAFFTHFFVIQSVFKKYDIQAIILYSVGTNGLQTIFWAKYYKIPVVFRSLDILHQLVPHKILSPLVFVLETITYRSVAKVFAITPKLKEYVIKMGCDEKKAVFLPTGADEDIFYEQKKDIKLIKKYGIKQTDLVIVFAGTLYNFSGLDEIIQNLPQYISSIPNIKFLIVGAGEQLYALRKIINDTQMEKYVILAGMQDYKQIPKLINLADICINPFKPNKITNLIFPSKVYQYLSCGKPVLASKLDGMLELFPDNKGENYIYYFDDVHDFFHLIKKIKRKKTKQSIMSLQKITRIFEKELNTIN